MSQPTPTLSSLDSFDIEQYLARIGLISKDHLERKFKDSPQQSYSLLHAISWGQATHIPFENLSTIFPQFMRVVNDLGVDEEIKVSLDPNDIFQKMVLRPRGGFCFEQNLLLARALREFDFKVTMIGAKGVNRFVEPELNLGLPVGCLTHLALLVECEDGNRYLVDNGLGWSGMPRSPLLLSNGIEKKEDKTGEMYRLVLGNVVESVKLNHDKWGCYRYKTGDDINHNKERCEKKWFLQYKNKPESDWWDIMHFAEDNEMSFLDAELGAWFASTSPNHPQTKVKLVALMTEDGRYSLIDKKFTIRKGGVTTEQFIEGEELWIILDNYFGIRRPIEN